MSKTTDTIAGLRFQEYPESKEIHVHDDAKNLKFVASTRIFKQDLSDALTDLKAGSGATIIGGTSVERLCLVSDGTKINAFVMADKDMAKELESFLKKL